jgi:restriction system protein
MSATTSNNKILSPFFPTYAEVRRVLPILDQESYVTFRGMIDSLLVQRGTRTQHVSWPLKTADEWIAQRLVDEQERLALRLWERSGRTVNPRYLRGADAFIQQHGLMETDTVGILHTTDRGKAFLQEGPGVVREIDKAEGVTKLMECLAARGKVGITASDMWSEWKAFAQEQSNLSADSTIKHALDERLANPVERGLLARTGRGVYRITASGWDHLG